MIYFFCRASTGVSALTSDLQGEGDASQVSVGGRIVNDSFSVQFTLNLDLSAVLDRGETNSNNWSRVVSLVHRWRVHSHEQL